MKHTLSSVTVLSAPTPEDIRLDPISETQWRVVDQRLSADDTPWLFSSIECDGRSYEILVIGDGCARWTFASLSEALTLFTEPRETNS